MIVQTVGPEQSGDACSRNSQWLKAAGYYKLLILSRPDYADAYYKYGGALAMNANQVNSLKALTLIGDIESAFLQAISLDPKHINARWALVEYYLKVPGIFGGSEKKALRYANELQQLSTVDGYLAKGRIQEYFNRYKQSESWLLKAFEAGQSQITCNKLVSLYTRHHQYQKAESIRERYRKLKSETAIFEGTQIN